MLRLRGAPQHLQYPSFSLFHGADAQRIEFYGTESPLHPRQAEPLVATFHEEGARRGQGANEREWLDRGSHAPDGTQGILLNFPAGILSKAGCSGLPILRGRDQAGSKSASEKTYGYRACYAS